MNLNFSQKIIVKYSKIKEIIKNFFDFDKEELEAKKSIVRIAGRVMRIRSFGKLIFAKLADQDDNIQLLITEENSEQFKKINIGDIIEAKGKICKTNKGELSIKIDIFFLSSKCLKILPDAAYYGLKDTETRFRKRYLDFIINPDRRKILIERHKIIKNIRHFLDSKDFIEIETPVLVSEASGAQAKPFITHHNKLHRDFYLRIATEIPLKTLLIGGFEKIYEIGRIFRNEGIDARHNPEFTTIEIYAAYENSEYMMNLTEELIKYIARSVNYQKINLKEKFSRISMLESIKKNVQVDFNEISDFSQASRLAKNYNILLEKHQNTIGHIIYAFFEKYVEKNLTQPTFIYDFPAVVSPLAKTKADNHDIADRFELYMGIGKDNKVLEFANGYSELNDPEEQQKNFEEQSKQKELGNEEIVNSDQEFIEALEYGMPPAGGLGIGIDRLIMFFTDQDSIKEVIAFPQLKNKL